MTKPEYQSVWVERKAQERQERDLAIQRAKTAAKILKEKYKAEEVILFGSLIWRPDFWWWGTDIDLLVKGLEGERYFEVLAEISSLVRPFHIDMVPWEDAWPSLRERALREGRKL